MPEFQSLRALIFANGDPNDGPAVQVALRHAPDALLIAADGGARLARVFGLTPRIIVGDMDSLTPQELEDFQAHGTTLERHPAGKDETDLELALMAAVRQGAVWIRLIGAVGDRLDQTLANVDLLALPALEGKDVRLVAGRQTLWLIRPGSQALDGAPGDTISLIPLTGDALDVRTEGLLYPLRGETLRLGLARGISNVIQSETPRVSFAAGLLLVVHTPGRA